MTGEKEKGFDSTSSRTRKRMLPSVAEVARELSRRTGADAASILTISRKVCAEELVGIKEGHESAPVEVLVERARALLEQEAQPTAGAFVFEPPPPPPVAPSAPAPPLPEGADPFGEAMGKVDLRWEGDAMEFPHGDGEEVPPAPRPSSFVFNPDEPFASERAEAPAPVPLQPPPAHRSKLPFLLAVALLLAVAGGSAWVFLSGQSKPAGPPPPLAVAPKPKAAPAEAPAPTRVPARPTAIPQKKAPSADKPRAGVEVQPPSATQVQVRAGTLITPDWTAAPVHVVHFSSFVEKAQAAKHAAVLAKELGLPARAVQVDLGDKGIWYRAVVGEFATAEEALALRNQLLERGTPGVGFVYRMTGKK